MLMILGRQKCIQFVEPFVLEPSYFEAENAIGKLKQYELLGTNQTD
jgi:hypothetical protein